MTADETMLLNRILEEIRGLAAKIDANDAKHADLATRVTCLEVDLKTREKAAASRTAYVCAFGAIVVSAVVWLVNLAYDNKARVDAMNSFGTAYGRGKEEVFNSRFVSIEQRLPKEEPRR